MSDATTRFARSTKDSGALMGVARKARRVCSSAVHSARVTDDNAAIISRMAMISIDQVLHGPRDPTGSDISIET